MPRSRKASARAKNIAGFTRLASNVLADGASAGDDLSADDLKDLLR